MSGNGAQGFDRLEEAVSRLVKSHDELRDENGALRAALEEKEREIVALKEMIARLGREKGAVRERVDVLLGRLDGLV